MEDLPLDRIAALVPEFCSEGPALEQNTDDDDDIFTALFAVSNRPISSFISNVLSFCVTISRY